MTHHPMMHQEDIEVICTTVIALGLMVLIGWILYLNKR